MGSLYSAAKNNGLKIKKSGKYEPCRVLVLYGMGGADRFGMANEHIKNGGTVLAFDIGYWDRDIRHRKYRVSLNGLHPKEVLSAAILRKSRLKKQVFEQHRSYVNKIMLVGNAPKSVAVGAKNWTAQKAKEIRKHFPEAKIIYRPKPQRPREKGVDFDSVSEGEITHALSKVDLVVCRHSNVAVDAAFMGVPVVATDGAASLIYPSNLKDYLNQPSLDIRRDFLERLAYWQWGENETELFWNWFFRAFPAYDYR